MDSFIRVVNGNKSHHDLPFDYNKFLRNPAMQQAYLGFCSFSDYGQQLLYLSYTFI